MLKNHIAEIKNYSKYHIEDCINNFHDLAEKLKNNGLIHLFGVDSDKKALALSHLIGSIHFCIDSDDNGITTISDLQTIKNSNNSLAFTHAGLYPHTDRSPIQNPPDFLLNWCICKPHKGGKILLSDGLKIYNHLKSNHPKTCEILSQNNIAYFSDSIDTISAPIFKIDSNSFSIRFRRDNCISFSKGLSEHVHILYEAIDLFTFSMKPKPGEGYLVNNKSWLHGRTRFYGDRVVKRIQIYKK